MFFDGFPAFPPPPFGLDLGNKRPAEDDNVSTKKKTMRQELVPLPRFWQSLEDAWEQVPGESNAIRLKLVPTLRKTKESDRPNVSDEIDKKLMLPFLEAILRTYTLEELHEWEGHLKALRNNVNLHGYCESFCDHLESREYGGSRCCRAYIVCLGEKFYSAVNEYSYRFWVDEPFRQLLEVVADVKSYLERKPYMQQNRPVTGPPATQSTVLEAQIKTEATHDSNIKNPAAAPSNQLQLYTNKTINSEEFWASIDMAWSGVDKINARTRLLAVQKPGERWTLAANLPMAGMITALQATLDSFTYVQIREWQRHLEEAKSSIEGQVKDVFNNEHNARALLVISCGKAYFDAFKYDPVTFHVKVTSDALGSLASKTISKNFGDRFLK